MSSHREAPEISKDPVADSTDLYAFVSPDNPSTVTIIANYVPLQQPAGGPNFYEFGDDVLYEIHIDNDADGDADITYQFRFNTVLSDTGANDIFLYNTGQIKHLSDTSWNRKQFYSVSRVDRFGYHQIAEGLACPPCNVGKNSIPSYGPLTAEAIHTLGSDGYVFAGQRADGFYVDLGSIFDLGDLRPFQPDFLLKGPAVAGINTLAGLNVHSIAIQVPIKDLTRDGKLPSSYTRKRRRHRCMDHRQSAKSHHQWLSKLRDRAMGTGVTSREPVDQRGNHPHGTKGLLELTSTSTRRSVSRGTTTIPRSRHS